MFTLSVAYISILTITAILIIVTLLTLPNIGDERIKMIKTKAQSITFTIIIMLLVIEVGKDLYSIFWGSGLYEAKPPIFLLTSASIIYLGSLLVLRRKFGN